jgi:citrate synthase
MTRNMLSAAQVAARLGVQRATVYAYVSRGLLPRTVGLDGRTSWFDPDDVDELARRGRPRSRRERAGSVDVVLTTAVTQVADERLEYRGHDVADLARECSFEGVAELLWTGVLADPDPPPWAPPAELLVVADAATAALPPTAPVTARLAVAVAAMAAADEARGDLRPATVRATARTMLAVLARTPAPVGPSAGDDEPLGTATALWPRLSPAPPEAPWVRCLDRTLVALADHELATSTLAARVAASTRANPFACVLAAVGALSGPLHGRAAVGVHRLLLEAHGTGDVAAAVEGALGAGHRLPGFGHALYRGPDPRAEIVLGELAAVASPDVLTTVGRVRTRATGATGDEANVDFALGALALAARMPLGATEGVFAVARTAGWVAHVLEEYDERPLRYRARAIHTGPHGAG